MEKEYTMDTVGDGFHFEEDTETQSDRIERKLDTVLEKMAKIEELTVTVIEQVKPTLDELMNSSLIKMLGIKKGK